MPEKLSKKRLIKDLKRDEVVNDIFVVKFKKPVEPYKNGFKFELRLGDSSREIMYKFWGPAEEAKVRLMYGMIKQDDVVLVQGRVNEWNNQLEISANEHHALRVLSKEEYDQSEFIRQSERDIEEMFADLVRYVDSVRNPELKKILDSYFRSPEFIEDFKKTPAAMYIHHAWIGGLLEHTLSVVRILDRILEIQKRMDRDLAITGGILHDIGKIHEFEVSTSIRVSKEGMLIGHTSIALQELSRVMEGLKTPEEIRLKLLHMIMTHMGEYGSSKQPAFPEALAVFYADQMDARLAQMSDLKETAPTEDDYFYHKDFGNIYLR